MKRDDTLWKGILEDIFDNFLVFIFKEKAAIFDFTKDFEFLNNELAQIFPVDETAAAPKFVDKLVKVFTVDGTEEWVLVHIEVQGYNDAGFARRMFTYFYRILDKFDKRVTCVAIFTGGARLKVAGQYDYDFLGTLNTFKYNVYNIAEQNADALSRDDNPFALVVLTVLIALQKGELGDEELLKLYKGIAKTLLQKNIEPRKARAVMNFLKYYVGFASPKNVIKFEEEIKLLTNNNTTMGIEEMLLERAARRGRKEGREEGREEGRVEGREEGIGLGIEKSKVTFVRSLLQDTEFDEEKIASLTGVDVAFVANIKAQLNK